MDSSVVNRRPALAHDVGPERGEKSFGGASDPRARERVPEVSVVIPCLNEADTLEVCIRKAQKALQEQGVEGEIVVADNGSTDGSIQIAIANGARVVPVTA